MMMNLDAMGYTEAWRQKVLREAMTGYTRILAKVSKGLIQRNRKGKDTLTNRRF